MDAIENHTWPGNVREMENCIKRAVIMTDGPQISVEDLGLTMLEAFDEHMNLRQVRDAADYKAIVKALARFDGNITKASGQLGISRPTLHELMSTHGLKKTSVQSD